jgi:flagellar basal-body rod protein FlgG
MWIAASGMMAQQLNIDVISNNLANVNTIGYKKSRADFEDLMYQRVTTPSIGYDGQVDGTASVQVGLGVRNVGVPKIYTEGNVNQTNNELDIAIEGEGFFQVQMPGGEIGYTRAGNFKKNGDGYITTPNGYLLLPAIQVPEDSKALFVSPDGKVAVSHTGQTTTEEIGQLQIALFANPTGLENVGRNIVVQSAASGDPMLETPGMNGAGTLAQGYLEASNVDIAEEMIKMIMAQRAYEINSKAIQSSDELLAMTNNLRR